MKGQLAAKTEQSIGKIDTHPLSVLSNPNIN